MDCSLLEFTSGSYLHALFFVITELEGVLKRLTSSRWSNKQAKSICMQMLQVLCQVLGCVSHLHASKTSSPSALCAEASFQSLVKSVGLPTTTGGLWTWVWDRKDANCYQPLWFCQELPCIRKDFPVLGIKPTHKKNGPALEIFVVICIGHWLDLVTSKAESTEPVLPAQESQEPLELELGEISSFCSFWQKERTGSLLTSVSELSFIVYSVWVCS